MARIALFLGFAGLLWETGARGWLVMLVVIAVLSLWLTNSATIDAEFSRIIHNTPAQ